MKHFQLTRRNERVVWSLWSSGASMRQLALLVIAWTHDCLGLHLALRHRRRYRRYFYLFFALALTVPILSALGYLAKGRELMLRGTAISGAFTHIAAAAASLQ